MILSLTHARFDRRADGGVTWWPVDIVVNPTSGIQSIGVGTSFSYRAVRLGIGHLWSKHEVLGGQSIGQVLGDSEDLNIRDSYHVPDNKWKGLYFSLSITGVPPFVPEAP